MDNIPNLVPNFPPPPIRPPPPAFKNNANLYKERLQNYLLSRKNRLLSPHMPNEVRQKPMKLSEISIDLSRFYDTVETMKSEIENLSNSASTILSSQWNNQITELKSQLNELSTIREKYENSNVCNNAKRAVEKRLKKRSHIKKRKAELNAMKECEMKNRKLKHHQIDQWLNRNAENIRENRRKIENKQQAEQVLTEVKSLKNDAAKHLLLFDSLKELYRIRSRDKASTAMYDIEFNREMDKLKNMWMDASVKYEMEEKRLRTFLNCSNHCDEWQGILFGDVKSEDLFSLKKNENGLTKLIEIRRQWDSFIVSDDNPHGSSIPLGWVIPNSNPSEKWKVYLEDNNE